jgi:cysteine synthase
MAQPERYDILVLGSGTGGKLRGLAHGAIRTAHRCN